MNDKLREAVMAERVRCRKCGRSVAGWVPRGGDGSLLVARAHKCTPRPDAAPPKTADRIRQGLREADRCPFCNVDELHWPGLRTVLDSAPPDAHSINRSAEYWRDRAEKAEKEELRLRGELLNQLHPEDAPEGPLQDYEAIFDEIGDALERTANQARELRSKFDRAFEKIDNLDRLKGNKADE